MTPEAKVQPMPRPDAPNHAHDIRFYPNTVGRGEQAARLRDALRFSITHPVNTEGLAGKRWKALETLDQYVSRNESRIRLGDFDPPEGPGQIVDRLRRSTFMPAGTPAFNELVEQAQTVTDRRYFSRRGERGHALIAAFDKLAFERIQTEYGLSSPEEARRFFEARITDANEVTRKLADTKIPDGQLTHDLRNETSFITSPGKLVYHALTSNATPKLSYEALRALSQAELLAINAKHAEGVRNVVDEFQTVIDDEIFDHGQLIGETKRQTIWAFFDKETGEPVWNSYSDMPLTPNQFREFSETAMLKSIKADVRHSDVAGNVLTSPRTKGTESILEKMINDTEQREALIGDSVIEPGGVTDLGGIMHVLLDEASIDGPTMEDFIKAHITLARNAFGEETRVESRDQKTARNGSSQDHQFRRLEIFPKVNGRTYKIEMLFVPIKVHLKNENTYGEIDSETGLHKGPAHLIYEATRWEATAKRWFPGGEEYYGTIDWNKLVAKDSKDAVAELQNQNTVPADNLPLIYRQLEVTLI